MRRQDAERLRIGDRVIWRSPHPRIPQRAGTVREVGPSWLRIDWDDGDLPVIEMDRCQFLELERNVQMS